MNEKCTLLWVGLLLTLLISSGCQKSEQGVPDPQKKTQVDRKEGTPKNPELADPKTVAPSAPDLKPATLSLWHTYRAEEKAALEEIVKEFNAQKGPITIDAVPVPYDAFVDKLEITIPNGHGPDLFIFAHNMVGHWASQGLISPLSGSAKPEMLKRFLPETVKALVHNKALYGLPLAYKSLVLYYNVDLIASPPTSLEGLIAEAKKQKAKPGIAFETGKLYFHAPFLFGHGGHIFDENGKPDLVNPGAIQALDQVKSLVDSEVISNGLSSITVSALFNEGKVPFVFNGPWFRGEIDAEVRYGTAPLPTLGNGASMKPFLGSEAVFISAKSPWKEHAFQVAAYLTSDASASVRAIRGKQTIANTAVYELPEVKKDPSFGVFRAQSTQAKLMPSSPTMQKVWAHYDTAIQKVMSGTASSNEALKSAQALVTRDTEPER